MQARGRGAGIGARLDSKPELLFKLRGVDHEELIAADAEKAVAAATSRGKSKRLAADDISAVLEYEIDTGNAYAPTGSTLPATLHRPSLHRMGR